MIRAEERASWWSTVIASLGERHWPCDRHNSFQLVPITGDSWDGRNELVDVEVNPLYNLTWAYTEDESKDESEDNPSDAQTQWELKAEPHYSKVKH